MLTKNHMLMHNSNVELLYFGESCSWTELQMIMRILSWRANKEIWRVNYCLTYKFWHNCRSFETGSKWLHRRPVLNYSICYHLQKMQINIDSAELSKLGGVGHIDYINCSAQLDEMKRKVDFGRTWTQNAWFGLVP